MIKSGNNFNINTGRYLLTVVVLVLFSQGGFCGPEEYPTVETAIAMAYDGDVIVVPCDEWEFLRLEDIDLMGKDIIVRSDCPDDSSYLCSAGIVSKGAKAGKANKRKFASSELIIKYKQDAADNEATQLMDGLSPGTKQASSSLQELNKKYKLKKSSRLFAGFKDEIKQRQEMKQMPPKLLTKKQQG
ncbi:MAG: hypothetical protein KAS23_15270, partial [Anaerohalosphaera sp.]|nr:hypothetical protein [Anaerohalosphaera sp.]